MTVFRSNTRAWKKLEAKLSKLGRGHARVGAPGEEHDEAGIPLSKLLAIHELGAPSAGIPARRPLRQTMSAKSKPLGKFAGKVAKALMRGKITETQALDLLGQKGAAEVRKTITAGPHLKPALQPETKSRKGSSRPLVDTGQLAQSITHEVVKK